MAQTNLRKVVWHVVTGQGNVVLGAYAEGLLSLAQECARKVEYATGLHTHLHQVKGDKPKVGATLSESNWLAADPA